MNSQRVHLVKLGEFLDVDLDRLARRLNRLQETFQFEYFPNSIKMEEIGAPAFDGKFYDADQILSPLHDRTHDKVKQEDLIIAIGAIRIAHLPEPHVDSVSNAEDHEWLGIWQNEFCPLRQEFSAIGLISIHQWIQRYEETTYRSSEQYICHMLIAFLGDVLFGGTLTHPDFRWCVFDLNDDIESVAESVKKCRIDPGVIQTIHDFPGKLRNHLCKDEVIAAFKGMSLWVKRPHFNMIFKYLSANATTNFFIIGILLANSVNPVINVVKASLWTTLGMGAIFIFLILKLYYSPSGKLG